MSPRRWRGALVVVALGGLGLASCKATAPMHRAPGMAEPGGRAYEGGDAAPSDIDSLEAELARAENELHGLDGSAIEAGGDEVEELGVSSPEPSRQPEVVTLDRCERVRQLADRICDLSDRMCALADEHEDEARYVQACERSELSCGEARTASDGCVR